MKKIGLFLLMMVISLFLTVPAFSNNTPSSGFLVIAPDRGYQGNREIRNAFEEFRKGFRTDLVFVSLNPDDEEKVRTKLEDGLAELKNNGASEVVLLPMVLTDGDPHLKKAKALLGDVPNLKIAPRWGTTTCLLRSWRTGQGSFHKSQ